MATLSSARTTLLDLKVQLARTQKQRAAALTADAQANVSTFNATIANLESQVVSQRHALRTFSGFANAAAAASTLPVAASQAFDPQPTQGSGNAVQSGGVFAEIQTKQDAGKDLTFASLSARDVATTGAITATGAITGRVLRASQTNVTSVGTLSSLNVDGDLKVGALGGGANLLVAGPTTGNVGVNRTDADPAKYALDVNGEAGTRGIPAQPAGYLVNYDLVLDNTTLGANVVSSHLRTLGNLSALSVSGNISQSRGTANLQAVTATTLSASGNVVSAGLRDRGYTIVGDVNANGSFPPSTDVGLAISHNLVANDRQVTFMNNDVNVGTSRGGVCFRQRTGVLNDFTTNSAEYVHFARDRMLVLGVSPIQFREYEINPQDGTGVIITDVTADSWHPMVAAVRFTSGDLNELVRSNIYEAFFAPARVNPQDPESPLVWHFKTELLTHNVHESAKAICMFVHKSLTGQVPTDSDSHLGGTG